MRKLSAILLITFLAGIAQAMSLPKTTKVPGAEKKNASFTENWERYPSSPVIIARLKAWFPGANDMCLMLTPQNQALLGDSNPITGTPVYEQPGAPFIEWFSKCVAALAFAESQLEISTRNEEKTRELYGDRYFEKCGTLPERYDCRILDFSEEELNALIDHQLFYLVGDDALLELRGLGPKGDTIRAELRAFLAELKAAGPNSIVIEGVLKNEIRQPAVNAVAFIKYLVLVRMDQRI